MGIPPRERIASTRLNILESGIAARGGDLLYGGGFWGEDMILTAPVLRDTYLLTFLLSYLLTTYLITCLQVKI